MSRSSQHNSTNDNEKPKKWHNKVHGLYLERNMSPVCNFAIETVNVSVCVSLVGKPCALPFFSRETLNL
jgi:hypothetical protein